MLVGVSIYLQYSLATAYSHAPTCRHTCTPSSYTCTTYAHPHAHSPAHLYTHSFHTYTHPSNFTRTTYAHPYTYLQISTNINSPQLSQSLFTNICKYPHCHCTWVAPLRVTWHYNQNSIQQSRQ